MTDRNDFDLMSKIADRALPMYNKALASPIEKIDVVMDLEYVNREAPLNLLQLLEFDAVDFAHDMFGIYENFDRGRKTMLNCFTPRCSL